MRPVASDPSLLWRVRRDAAGQTVIATHFDHGRAAYGDARDVAQRYIDSLVESSLRSRQARELSLQVRQKYVQTDDQRALNATYAFFVGSVIPQYPTATVAQFADTVDRLSATNPQIRDLSQLLDNFACPDRDRPPAGRTVTRKRP
jgi:hypothetical protein